MQNLLNPQVPEPDTAPTRRAVTISSSPRRATRVIRIPTATAPPLSQDSPVLPSIQRFRGLLAGLPMYMSPSRGSTPVPVPDALDRAPPPSSTFTATSSSSFHPVDVDNDNSFWDPRGYSGFHFGMRSTFARGEDQQQSLQRQMLATMAHHYSQLAQNRGGHNDGQEIDLTVSSDDDSDHEPDTEEEQQQDTSSAANNEDEDEVEIVSSTLRPLHRKRRRRTNTSNTVDSPEAPRTKRQQQFDVRSAESTNISIENNETIEKFKQALKCSICLDVMKDMTSTICGHVYCSKCICIAIRVTGKCPLCQRRLLPKDTHPLYF